MTGPDAVGSAVGRFFRAVDTRDWGTVVALLADAVATDYTSVFGGEPETVDGAELATRWRALLPGFDATQHFLGPLLPAGENTVECNVRGHHALDHPHRELRDRAPRAGRAGAAPGRVTGERVAAR